MNPYYLKLNLPIKFVPIETDLSKGSHFKYDMNNVNPELINFLMSLGVTVLLVEVFCKNKDSSAGIHIDNRKLENNFVKLNYAYGCKDSLMTWYKLKEGKKLILKKTSIGTGYKSAELSDVEEVYSTKITEHGLVNVGQLHGITNIKSPRICYSFVLGNKFKEQLEWNEAIQIFKGYY